MEALRKGSVPQAEIARIVEVSTETVRKMRMDAGLPADQRKVRGRAPGLIYAFRDEAGTWWPRGHERLLPDGDYAVGLEVKIPKDRPSRFAGQKLTVMCALEPDALPDDSPGYVYQASGRGRRTTQAVHDEIWRTEAN